MNGQTPTFSVDRPSLADVVGAMRSFAHKGKQDLEVRGLVEQIIAELEPGDYASECYACYVWVYNNIRYVQDIHDVEFVKEPRQLIRTKAGDCDDIATLLAAMLMSIGKTCDFVLVSFNGGAPSHVYMQAHTPRGPVMLDPVANSQSAQMLRQVRKKWVVPV
jgi:hypothetical protein